jgi:hypothetical protein
MSGFGTPTSPGGLRQRSRRGCAGRAASRRSRRSRTSHNASPGLSERPLVHVIHTPAATSHNTRTRAPAVRDPRQDRASASPESDRPGFWSLASASRLARRGVPSVDSECPVQRREMTKASVGLVQADARERCIAIAPSSQAARVLASIAIVRRELSRPLLLGGSTRRARPGRALAFAAKPARGSGHLSSESKRARRWRRDGDVAAEPRQERARRQSRCRDSSSPGAAASTSPWRARETPGCSWKQQ